MSYLSISTCVQDDALAARVEAAAAQEAWNNPALAATEFGEQVRQSPGNAGALVWPVSLASDVEAAYASALAAGNPNPGGDEAVVTDGMILANVQAHWPPDPT